jgi:hypothetical protein
MSACGYNGRTVFNSLGFLSGLHRRPEIPYKSFGPYHGRLQVHGNERMGFHPLNGLCQKAPYIFAFPRF